MVIGFPGSLSVLWTWLQWLCARSKQKESFWIWMNQTKSTPAPSASILLSAVYLKNILSCSKTRLITTPQKSNHSEVQRLVWEVQSVILYPADLMFTRLCVSRVPEIRGYLFPRRFPANFPRKKLYVLQPPDIVRTATRLDLQPVRLTNCIIPD